MQNNKSKSKNYISKEKGFTLVELIFVGAIFIVIIGATMSLFLSIVRQQRRILLKQELLNQTSYVIEYMSRAIRMAKKDATGVCLGSSDAGHNYKLTYSGKGIKFINHSDNDACQEFFFDPGDQKLKESKNNGFPISLISDKFQINFFKINLLGDSQGDNLQPRVTLSLEIQPKGTDDQSKAHVQTTISQRNLDVQ